MFAFESREGTEMRLMPVLPGDKIRDVLEQSLRVRPGSRRVCFSEHPALHVGVAWKLDVPLVSVPLCRSVRFCALRACNASADFGRGGCVDHSSPVARFVTSCLGVARSSLTLSESKEWYAHRSSEFPRDGHKIWRFCV